EHAPGVPLIGQLSLRRQPGWLGEVWPDRVPGLGARPTLGEQVLHVGPGEALYKSVVVRDQVSGQDPLLFLELQDLVFDRILADHAVSEDVLGLPDTVRPVDGLLFHGGGSSWV